MEIAKNPLEQFNQEPAGGKESQEIGVYQRVIAKAKELAQKGLSPEMAKQALAALEKINNQAGEKQWRQDFKEIPNVNDPAQQEYLWAKYLLINLGFADIELSQIEQTAGLDDSKPTLIEENGENIDKAA